MIYEKVQHFKVKLLQSDRTSEFAAIAKTTRTLKISAAATAIGTLLILLAPPVEAVNLTLVSDRAALGGTDRVDWSILGPVPPRSKYCPTPSQSPRNKDSELMSAFPPQQPQE